MTPPAYRSRSHLQSREIDSFASRRWDSWVSMNTAVRVSRSCQSRGLGALGKQIRSSGRHWILGGGRNDSPARYVPFRTQSPTRPLLPSPARTLLTYPRHHRSSAPFVITQPLRPFSAFHPVVSFPGARARIIDSPTVPLPPHFRPYTLYHHPINFTSDRIWQISISRHSFSGTFTTVRIPLHSGTLEDHKSR
jgi:hypothetical protein